MYGVEQILRLLPAGLRVDHVLEVALHYLADKAFNACVRNARNDQLAKRANRAHSLGRGLVHLQHKIGVAKNTLGMAGFDLVGACQLEIAL